MKSFRLMRGNRPLERETKFYLVDAFTNTRFQGNPAGVVISSRPLTEPEMFDVAAEVHLETAFLWPAVNTRAQQRGGFAAAYSICYYTHLARIPLCGHDTIATGVVLAHRGELAAAGTSSDPNIPSRIVFKSDIGDLPIEIMPDGAIAMRQGLPQYEEECDASAVLMALGISSSKLTDHPIRVVSTGTPFLFVGVDNVRSVDTLSPDMPALTQAIKNLSPSAVAGAYVWADDRLGRTQTIYGRCFAPGAGLNEDPVTGSASGALATHLFDLNMIRGTVDGTASIQTTQGRAMGRPGHAHVTLIVADRRINSVSVSGHAVIVGEGTLYL
jgi:PhzF family phenazine biosynthesis protein